MGKQFNSNIPESTGAKPAHHCTLSALWLGTFPLKVGGKEFKRADRVEDLGSGKTDVICDAGEGSLGGAHGLHLEERQSRPGEWAYSETASEYAVLSHEREPPCAKQVYRIVTNAGATLWGSTLAFTPGSWASHKH